ncbi:preprotein translocase subunit SecG [Candidatus Profftella armatura (Diaphorina cf. continua)]|uniref:Protein-export membrane protein SecG n=1 Tax=Candidatus Profftella armatura (Diaphorina cf. continua) TaxID=2661583 RepID=A0A7R6W0R3_9PROT|nr:preprotein translocase subunit SecG [Candidatus Profftella armatura (Diaphorina cf. continua)]BCG49525.1 preprotein translocase subunit SecG [Candidatus Profftella armatura (Diaphorina cf. continua)]
MNISFKIIIFFQIISALIMINLITFQRNKNICFNKGTTINSGISNSLFGSIGSFNFIFKLIFIFAAIFFLSTIGLTYISKKKINNNTMNYFCKKLSSSKIPSSHSDDPHSDNHDIKIKK